MNHPSLYAKYGGFATVSSIVHTFYDRVLATPSLVPYFDAIDTVALIDHQTKLFCMLLGGPAAYSGRELRAAHASVSISSADFDLVAEVLEDTLLDAGMSDDDVAAVMKIVESTRGDIVKRAA